MAWFASPRSGRTLSIPSPSRGGRRGAWRRHRFTRFLATCAIAVFCGITASAALAGGGLPDGARGPAIPQDKGYLVEEIRDGLYWVTEGVYQVMFLTTGKGVIVADAPPSIGQNILKAIAEVTDEPVKYMVYSHSHADHVGAANIYPEGTTYIGHQETAAALANAKDPRRPVPTVTFADSYTLEVGSQKLILDYKGTNHEPGNIFIYAPRQKVLMLVDVIFPGWVPFKSLALTKDVPGYVKAHEQALAYDFDTFIGGHLTRLGTRQDVEVAREFLRDLMAAAGKALQETDFMAIAQQTGFENLWLLFDTYMDTVAATCNKAMLSKWGDRLGGAEVFTADHCLTMAEALRIDFAPPGQ